MALRGVNYIPNNNIAFCDFVETGANYAKENHERWGVEAPPIELADKLMRLKTLAHLCTTSKHTPEDMVERNTLRKEVEREVRNYLQGFVMRNPHVTNLDRSAMGLPQRDTKPTPIGEPEGQVTAKIFFRNERELELKFEHLGDPPTDKRANYGVKIAYDVFPIDAPAPENAGALHRSEFVRRQKILLKFAESESHKIVWFRLRYENSKGKPGLWGPMFNAIIP